MKRNGLRACKLTQKSGLTEAMMKARYHFCMRYKERKERYQRRKAGRRPGGSEVKVDEEDW